MSISPGSNIKGGMLLASLGIAAGARSARLGRRPLQRQTTKPREIPHCARNDGEHSSEATTARATPSGSRPDGQLDFAAARLHPFESLRQVREPNFLGDEVVRGDITAADGLESFADKPRRMVERGNQLEFRI